MSSEPTPTDNQPQPNPPANSGLAPPSPIDALKPGLDGKVESLKKAVISILEGTEWPPNSTDAAKSLKNAIDSCPDISPSKFHMTKELQNLIKKYRKILDDVHIRLRDASSEAAMKRWKFLQMIKPLTSNRPSKCTLLFHTCEDDILKATDALNERLKLERKKESGFISGFESSTNIKIQSVGQGGARSLVLDPPTGTRTLADDSTPNSLLPKDSLSGPGKDSEERSPISEKALVIARKTFKSVEIESGAIPVVGSYVGAAAKVGLAFVEMLQTMDRNDSLAIDLSHCTSTLTALLENFKGKSNPAEKVKASQVNTLHMELVWVKGQVEEWSSLGRFEKAFSARDHAEKLKEYRETIQITREEIHFLASLDSRNIIFELENIELWEERRRLLQRLGDGQYGARSNTIEDIICFPGTRLEILKKIDDWIRDASTRSPVLWICGMAGRGKSTIASTVIHNWKCRASCAIFHCRRGQSTFNSQIICALARQLGSSLVLEVKDEILESLRENEDIADPGRRLDEQFETLLVTPLAKLNVQRYPILIVIDALDECDNAKDAVGFVKLIHKHSSSLPKNVKFLLTSRPKAAILRNLESKEWHKEDLDSTPDVNNDLSRFIQAACTEIREDRRLPEDWPSPGDVKELVGMSQGLFQWARTAITYMNNGSPIDRLRALLKRPSAWSGLDNLYHQILSKAFDSVRLDPERQDILSRVLGILVTAPHSVSLEVIADIYYRHKVFDGANQEHVIAFLRNDILVDLTSLLLIPESPTESLRLMHTTIYDLLTSELQCKQQPFYVELARCHQQLANTCFEIMLESLRENICNLSDISKSSLELQDVVERVLPKGLRYSCRAWPVHLTEGVKWPESVEKETTRELAHFKSFSEGKVMYWLEVTSLIGVTMEAISAAKRVHRWLMKRPRQPSKHDTLVALWYDVRRFITTFLEPISFSPLHIYVSALPQCPTETQIWSLYGKLAKVRVLHGDRMPTPSNLWTRSFHGEVNTVAFSPDGRVLAVGSGDKTIRLLDAQTGKAVAKSLKGHSATVRSISFSLDGNVLASASDDGTVRLWNSNTGAALGEPLSGDDSRLWCVCFSPCGKLLASGSVDKTVRLWNVESGTPIGEPLRGHSDEVNSVCFSPDGKLVASGSDDGTIRFWNPETGAALGEPLTGHSAMVRSVCFCPNGSLLASGSNDNTVRLWAIETRTQAGEQVIRHNGTVYSVCFSPNGKLLASGSEDQTIRLWDTQTGAALSELTGHSAGVWSVCFSPDGKLLASGSKDKTVRLWDPQAGAAVVGSHISHSAKVNSVCFSPDGKRVASVYDDNSIRIWDPQTGAAVGEPLTGHSGRVSSVCFSPDGWLLASGSDDGTIRLWDTQNGVVGEPLEGASGSDDSWDAQTDFAMGEPLTGHKGRVSSFCFSPDGWLLASGSDDGTIRLWDAQIGVAVGGPLEGHGDWVRSVCFSPDGRYLASGSYDCTIRLWDSQTRWAVGEPLKGHKDYVRSVCFSPDGKYLVSGSDDKTIRLWDPQTRAAVGGPLGGHSDYVMSVSFSSDGTLLMARCHDSSLATWDVSTRQICDTPRSQAFYAYPHFQDHWITFGSSRFLWLPPQYWTSDLDGVALLGGHLVAFQNGSLSILDVSEILGTLDN